MRTATHSSVPQASHNRIVRQRPEPTGATWDSPIGSSFGLGDQVAWVVTGTATGPAEMRDLYGFVRMLGARRTRTQADLVQTLTEPQTETEAAASRMIYEIRRLSGLTWDQLSRLMGVSRRAVHYWASGSDINLRNQERLARLLSAIRHLDQGTAEKNRERLLSPLSDAETMFDLLAQERYTDLRLLATKGAGRAAREWKEVDLDRTPTLGSEPLHKLVETFARSEDGAASYEEVEVVSKPKYRRLALRRK